MPSGRTYPHAVTKPASSSQAKSVRLSAVSLGTPFSENRPAFYSHTWDAGDQRGDYYGFIIAVTAGAVAGGTVTEDQLLGFATAPFKVH